MRLQGPAKTLGQGIERGIPTRTLAIDFRVQKSVRQIQGLAQGTSLAAKPARIGRVLRIARDAPP